jgi:Mrp family chromosome partitioning ATPase
MSTLDQAFIKAYAKDQPDALTAPPTAVAVAAAPPRAYPQRLATGTTVEQLYRDGTLYRVETPRAASHNADAVPRSHLSTLPPTSPRRGVRRSLLKMLGERQSSPPADETSSQRPARFARKVIIRHVSHAVPSAPFGLTRAIPAAAAAQRAELPPETIADEPLPAAPLPTLPLIPQIAPLNEAIDFSGHIAIQQRWETGPAAPTMVCLPDDVELAQSSVSALVAVQIDSLEAMEQSQAIVRIDPAQATASQRPHIRFPVDSPASDDPVEPTLIEPEADSDNAETADTATIASPTVFDELTFADLKDEPLASDLIPVADFETAFSQTSIAEPEADRTSRPTVPVWEVDRFHWPKTCDKLMSDENGYLGQAGQKLLAAVHDGLRVLAITGSRRGEGRTTMALCLSRAAAAAGIQVAVMDGDFARPQLATKIALDVAFGWQDAALGKIPLSEAAVKSLADNITLLPLERTAAGKVLSLADPRVTATIRAAAATFELLILDLGPLGAGEQIAFPPGEACPLDAAIVLHDARFATAVESEATGRSLQEAGIEAVGIAENFVVDDE